ncbi:hypothetical protein RS3R2_26200 [Pseudomonas lactis]|nr:hypothetical protein RS3R2_26200 [Pseudomonas lactis]
MQERLGHCHSALQAKGKYADGAVEYGQQFQACGHLRHLAAFFQPAQTANGSNEIEHVFDGHRVMVKAALELIANDLFGLS